MRARTWLLVGAVALIGLAAVADSVRGRLTREQERSTAGAAKDRTAAPGLTGVLYYTDHFCLLKAIRLPQGTPAPAPPVKGTSCRFTISPDGLSAGGPDNRFAPRGRLEVASSQGLVQIFSRDRPVSRPFVASAPAFRPDGTLTFFRGGRVVAWQGGKTLFSQRRLRAAARQALGAPRRRGVVVHELAWLSDSRAVAILAAGADRLLAVLEGQGLVAAWPGGGADFERLWASPRGAYFAVEGHGVLLFERDGRQRSLPRYANFHALAWSPDERWLAVATGRKILVAPAESPMRPRTRIDLEARDLAWQ